jgi:hypothetical protein
MSANSAWLTLLRSCLIISPFAGKPAPRVVKPEKKRIECGDFQIEAGGRITGVLEVAGNMTGALIFPFVS